MAYRPTQRTEARKAETRARIVAAARELIARGGYVAASVAAVADRADVAVGTVYRHFHSKSALFAEVFREAARHEADAMREALEANPDAPASERLGAGFETFARRALRGRRLAWALLAEPVDPAIEAERLRLRRDYRDMVATVIADGVSRGELPAQDPETTAAALVGATAEAMVGPLSPAANGGGGEATVAAIVNFCVRAIGNEPVSVNA